MVIIYKSHAGKTHDTICFGSGLGTWVNCVQTYSICLLENNIIRSKGLPTIDLWIGQQCIKWPSKQLEHRWANLSCRCQAILHQRYETRRIINVKIHLEEKMRQIKSQQTQTQSHCTNTQQSYVEKTICLKHFSENLLSNGRTVGRFPVVCSGCVSE